jgi:hypothetical protein
MRTKDIEIGKEYAAGSTSPHDEFRCARVRVLETGTKRRSYSGAWNHRITHLDGIRAEVITDWTGLKRWEGRREATYRPAEIRMPWDEYAAALDRHNARVTENRAKAESTRQRKIALVARMEELGIHLTVGDPSKVSLLLSEAERLVARIDGLEAALRPDQ